MFKLKHFVVSMAVEFTGWYMDKIVNLHADVSDILYDIEHPIPKRIGPIEADIIRMERKRIANEK